MVTLLNKLNHLTSEHCILYRTPGFTILLCLIFNRSMKKKRTTLQSNFTESGPGKSVMTSFDEVMHNLHFPDGPQRKAAQELGKTMSPSRLQEAWSEGRFYLLPSFLNFLMTLVNRQDNIKLVFRTFGDDIPDVAKEIDLLISGNHPYCPGKRLPASFQLDPSSKTQVGTFFRNGFDVNGTALAIGTLLKVPFTNEYQSSDEMVQEFYTSKVSLVRGFAAIDGKIHEMMQGHSTIALRDYWEWWSAHAEDGEYGKLLLVNETDEDIVVFFDDHIEAHHSHIVDVRNILTGAPIPFETSTHRKYLQRVEPFAAITDSQYFIKLVDSILEKKL